MTKDSKWYRQFKQCDKVKEQSYTSLLKKSSPIEFNVYFKEAGYRIAASVVVYIVNSSLHTELLLILP